jgi:hypothetical protein
VRFKHPAHVLQVILVRGDEGDFHFVLSLKVRSR